MHQRSTDQVMFWSRLVVVGAGYIGCEQACIFNNLGAEVHFIVRQVNIMSPQDQGLQSDADVPNADTLVGDYKVSLMHTTVHAGLAFGRL